MYSRLFPKPGTIIGLSVQPEILLFFMYLKKLCTGFKERETKVEREKHQPTVPFISAFVG